jgi:predicted acetyltransferase
MIGETYGVDRTDDELGNQRAATDLKRTVAVFDGGAPVAGASVYNRLLTVPGTVVPVAGIASVGVTPSHRRRGLLTAMVHRMLTDLHDGGGEPVAVLRPSEAAIYGRYGFGPATRGNLMRCERRSMLFRPGVDFGAGQVRLLNRASALPLITELYEQVRSVSLGWPDRGEPHWTVRLFDEQSVRGSATRLRYAIHTESNGRHTGYALYRQRSAQDLLGEDAGVVQVVELAAASRTAYASLWRFLSGIDLMPWVEAEGAVDEALPHLLADPRCVRSTLVDRLWVRLVDVDRALAARRYAIPLDLVIEVEDAFCPWNAGRYRLRADGDTATCDRTQAPAQLRLTAADLGAAFLGGTTLCSLAASGSIEEIQAGALATASAAFRAPREPFYPGGWAFPLY